MAKKGDGKKNSGKMEAYPSEPIARDIATEGSRRNIEIVIWYKRLITGTLGLLAVSALFTVVAALFAWRQAPPEVFASAQDGPLYPLIFSHQGAPEELEILMKGLRAESDSRLTLGGRRVSVDAAVREAEAKRLKQAREAAAAAAAAGSPPTP